ncbi:hypothetical protein LPJ81_007064 [Coemansia sp. IMI 209127]|nr:hypothetical protein LPJ81_007064 [Coemansia sp. IMI 209127]
MVPFDIDSPPLKSTSGNSKSSSGDKEGATARTSTCASSSLATSGVGLSAPSASLANARYALLGKYSDATTGFDAALQTAPMRGRTVARTPGCSRVSLFRQDRRATSALSQVYVYADIIQVDVARWKPSTARSPTQANGPRQAALQPLLDRIQELCTPLGE